MAKRFDNVIICPNPNCRFNGKAFVKKEFSGCLATALIILFFPIGLVYLVFAKRFRVFCPRCGMQIAEG